MSLRVSVLTILLCFCFKLVDVEIEERFYDAGTHQMAYAVFPSILDEGRVLLVEPRLKKARQRCLAFLISAFFLPSLSRISTNP